MPDNNQQAKSVAEPTAAAQSVPTAENAKTQVGKWLIANDAGQYVNAIIGDGYEDLADLTADIIDKVVSKPGIKAKLKRLLADAQKKPEDKHAPAIPQLPPGTTLDLTKQTCTTPDGISFDVPTQFSPQLTEADKAVVRATDLTMSDWLALAKNANLLFAYKMGDPSDGLLAAYAALNWVVSDEMFYKDASGGAKTSTSVTYSAETKSLVQSGFDSESASASYPFCSASFQREHKERTAQASATKKLQMIGVWRFPRATIEMKLCTAAAPRFLRAVKDALAPAKEKNSSDPKTISAVLQNLQDVFDNYGTAIPTEITVGACMVFTRQQEIDASQDESSAETTWKGAVSAAVGKFAADVSASSQTGTASSNSKQSQSDEMDISTIGGDTRLQDPKTWVPTISNPHNWAVFSIRKMRSIVDILPDDLRADVLKFWAYKAIPPAILPFEKLGVDSESKEVPRPGFVLASRHTTDNYQAGSATLVYNNGDDAHLGVKGAVGGSLSVGSHSDLDVWYYCSSLCLPIPEENESRYVAAKKDLSDRSPAAQFAFIPTRLTYGSWETVPVSSEARGAPSDGFLFVSIEAVNGQQGIVHCEVNGSQLAAASVHLADPGRPIFSSAEAGLIDPMPAQSFCLPIQRQDSYRLVVETQDPHFSAPKVSAWWLPIISPAWRLQRHEENDLDLDHHEKHDGILHGFVQARNKGDRADLRLYSGVDELNAKTARTSLGSDAVPLYACASMHFDPPRRWAGVSSAMLPVPGDWHHMAVKVDTYGVADAKVFWTAIVPAITAVT